MMDASFDALWRFGDNSGMRVTTGQHGCRRTGRDGMLRLSPLYELYLVTEKATPMSLPRQMAWLHTVTKKNG